MSRCEADVVVIGAGPAGSSVAIRLAQAGWRPVVIEQSPFPRPKVCGECLGPAGLNLLDELGVGDRVLDSAGPEIREVGWTARSRMIVAEMPPCPTGRHRYGRAIGRDILDAVLLERARELGVRIIQPARVRAIRGAPGAHTCAYAYPREHESRADAARGPISDGEERICSAIVIDAHGSWERGPTIDGGSGADGGHARQRPGDLLAFKASFRSTALPAGRLPVLSFPGGYGGMVVSDRGRTTVACCIRRDTLRRCRADAAARSAGAAVEAYLRSACDGVAAALEGARREDGWYAVGPLRTGFHEHRRSGVLAVGNAAMEAHPLIGEGICIALQSATLLAGLLGSPTGGFDERRAREVQERYARACRDTFARRLRLARVYAHIAMRDPLASSATVLMRSWPWALTRAAQLAGKSRAGSLPGL